MNHSSIQAKQAAADDLAACYARVFLGDDDGKRVLADLQVKFSHDRPRFTMNGSTVTAALVDGECRVLKEIESAIKRGTPTTGLPS